MKKTQISSQPLPKVQIISKKGEVISDVYTKNINLTEPGSIVKLSIDKGNIVGTKQVDDDLIIINSDNEEIVVENFFKTEGTDVNKIVIDDNGDLYVSSYDSPFNGLNFTSAESMESIIAGDSSSSVSWVVPVVALAAIGGLIAWAINDNDDDNHHSDSVDPNAELLKQLEDALANLDASSPDYAAARQALQDAINKLQTGSTTYSLNEARAVKANSIQEDKAAAEAAKETLQKTIAEYEANIATIESLIEQLGSAASDEARAALEAAKNTLAEMQAELADAQETIDLADQILSVLEQADNLKDSDIIEKTLDSANNAKANPSDSNIEQAKQLLPEYDQYITQLEASLKALNDALTAAKANGYTHPDILNDFQNQINEITDLLNNAQTSRDDIQAVIDQAVENKALVENANKLITTANTALDKAAQDYNAAKQALIDAKAAMLEAVSKNDLSKIDEINKQIDDANKALELAKSSYQEALDAYNAAKDALQDLQDYGVSSDFSDLTQLAELPVFNPNTDLASINSHLEVDSPDSFDDVIKNFINNTINYFKAFADKITNSTLSGIIKDVIGYLGGICDVIIGKIMAPCEAIKIGIIAIKDILAEKGDLVIDFGKVIISCISDVVNGTISVIMDSINGTIKGVVDAISDFINSGFWNWINPVKWVEAFVNGIENVVKNIWDVIKEIPMKIVDSIVDTIKTIAGDIWDSISAKVEIIAKAVGDIVNVFYEAFIKNPIDKIIMPIVDKIVDIITHPISSVIELVSTIYNIFKEGFDIIKDILKMPIDGLKAILDLTYDVLNSIFGEDKVIMVEDKLKALLEDSQLDIDQNAQDDLAKADQLLDTSETDAIYTTQGEMAKINDENLVIDKLLSDGDADVNLDNIVPVEVENAIELANVDHVDSASEVVALLAQMVLPQEEDYATSYAA